MLQIRNKRVYITWHVVSLLFRAKSFYYQLLPFSNLLDVFTTLLINYNIEVYKHTTTFATYGLNM